jgi:hypothetical protein
MFKILDYGYSLTDRYKLYKIKINSIEHKIQSADCRILLISYQNYQNANEGRTLNM